MSRLDDAVALPTRRGWKWFFALIWLVVFVAVSLLFAKKLTDVTKNNADAFLPPSAESTRAIHLAEDLFADKNKVGLTIVYVHDGGLTDADRAAIAAGAAAIKPYVVDGAVATVTSADGSAALVNGRMQFVEGKPTQFGDDVKSLRSTVHNALPQGLQVYVSGQAGAGRPGNGQKPRRPGSAASRTIQPTFTSSSAASPGSSATSRRRQDIGRSLRGRIPLAGVRVLGTA